MRPFLRTVGAAANIEFLHFQFAFLVDGVAAGCDVLAEHDGNCSVTWFPTQRAFPDGSVVFVS